MTKKQQIQELRQRIEVLEARIQQLEARTSHTLTIGQEEPPTVLKGFTIEDNTVKPVNGYAINWKFANEQT